MRSVHRLSWFLVALSAVLQMMPFAIAGPAPSWRRVFCWIALTPLLIAVLDDDTDKHRHRRAAWMGYVCGTLWYLGNCYWIYQTMYLYGGLAKPVAVGILLLFSLYLGLYHALFAWCLSGLRSRLGVWRALALSPFLWVAVELARARITGFPWDLLGYAQIENAGLLLLAPIGGVMLLSFLIACVNAAFAGVFVQPARRWQWGAAAVGACLVLQGAMLYSPAADAAPYSATLLQQNLIPGVAGVEGERLARPQEYQRFEELSRAPLALKEDRWQPDPAGSSSLIVWPESPADFFSHDAEFRSQVGGLARSLQTPVVAGSVGIDFDPGAQGGHHMYGSAVVFDETGRYVGRYDKVHRVPWGEYVPFKQLFFFADKLTAESGNMEAGTKHTVFDLNQHRVGIFICYESIFGDEVREYAKAGADLLVNISDDGWYGDTGAPWQHLDMERMRAVENRRWILRDTNTGVTTSIDPHGRGIFTTPRHVREAFRFHFNYLEGTTFYTRHGDWFAWLCAVVCVVALGLRKVQKVH